MDIFLLSTPIMICQPTETSSGRCDRWWMSGTRTWLNNSLLDGSHVWMRALAHGPTNTHAQDGCLFPESHIHLAMNTILCVVLPWELCGGWSLWKGKMLDAPHAAEHPKPKHNNHGNTVGLLVQIWEAIFARGSVVVLDSGFCVLKCIIELKKRGVYASALIKKCRYWPKYIKGDDIKSHCDDKDVGDCNAWKVQMDEVDFYVYAMKEPDYVMSIMSTYGTNQQMRKEMQCELVGGEQINFYLEVIGNHFLFQHSVDGHNNKQHSPISIEEIWGTKWWPNRVFAFLLAVTEVNMSLGMVELCGNDPTSQN